jgi:hypothetical protein
MTPEAARQTMRARIEVDNRLTSTTDRRIEELIAQAGELRRQYGVPTGFQRAPFFQVQTRDFALLAADTGVMRRLDPAQQAWLEGALAAARGKFTMAILGHPFYAGGHYQAEGDDEFVALHRRLREHGAAVVMAGDTHDLSCIARLGNRCALDIAACGRPQASSCCEARAVVPPCRPQNRHLIDYSSVLGGKDGR